MDLRHEHTNLIMRYLSYLKTRVELAGSLNLHDINIHAENFYRDLFNRIGYKFTNTNFDEKNAVSIDLIDKESLNAIQVTSQNDNSKITKSIKGFRQANY